MREKKRRRVFALFISIFLRNRSLNITRWFYGKKCKIGKGKFYRYLTENWLSRNEIWFPADNHNYMCYICAKGFLDSNFNLAVVDKISNFHEIAAHFAYSQKSYFVKKYNWNFLDQHLLSYRIYGWDMSVP